MSLCIRTNIRHQYFEKFRDIWDYCFHHSSSLTLDTLVILSGFEWRHVMFVLGGPFLGMVADRRLRWHRWAQCTLGCGWSGEGREWGLFGLAFLGQKHAKLETHVGWGRYDCNTEIVHSTEHQEMAYGIPWFLFMFLYTMVLGLSFQACMTQISSMLDVMRSFTRAWLMIVIHLFGSTCQGIHVNHRNLAEQFLDTYCSKPHQTCAGSLHVAANPSWAV